MREIVSTVLEWLERVIPGLLMAFGIGYNKGLEGKQKVETELKLKELELETKKNAEMVETIYSNTDNSSIVKRAIAKGRSLIRR